MTDLFSSISLADVAGFDAVATYAHALWDGLAADVMAAAERVHAAAHQSKYLCTYGAVACALALRFAVLRKMPSYHGHEDLAHLVFYTSVAVL